MQPGTQVDGENSSGWLKSPKQRYILIIGIITLLGLTGIIIFFALPKSDKNEGSVTTAATTTIKDNITTTVAPITSKDPSDSSTTTVISAGRVDRQIYNVDGFDYQCEKQLPNPESSAPLKKCTQEQMEKEGFDPSDPADCDFIDLCGDICCHADHGYCAISKGQGNGVCVCDDGWDPSKNCAIQGG